MVLIKDNHIATCENPLDALLKAKTNTSFSKKIEIEVETLDDAIECVKNGADIVMLDNMSPEEVSEVINKLNELNIRKCLSRLLATLWVFFCGFLRKDCHF